MGFFSWITSDTKKSIPNIYSRHRTFTVTMIDDKGNKFTEHHYEGYGEFGGKDYYELLDEMNGGSGDRDNGIWLAHKPTLADPKNYNEGDIIRVLQDDGTYKELTIPEYNKYQTARILQRPKVIKFPILVEDDSIAWSSKLRPETCPNQGYFC